MSGVKVTNLASFDAIVQSWLSAVEKAAKEAAVGMAHEAFEQILETSPQGSGDFVANTNVSVSHPNYEFVENAAGTTNSAQAGKGDEQAMNVARSKVDWSSISNSLVLGEPVFIASKAKHDQYYSGLIEEGKIKLRPINAGADHIYRRAKGYVMNRYAKIDKGALARLRGKAK